MATDLYEISGLCVDVEYMVMGVLAKCGINVVYSYSMISTYIVLSTSEPERAQALLADEPVELISQEDIARIVAERAAKEA